MGCWGQGCAQKRRTAWSQPRSASRGANSEPGAGRRAGAPGAGAERDRERAPGCAAVSVARVVLAPAPAPGRDGTGRGSGGAYLEVGSPLGHPAHHDVRRSHGPGGREAEAHVAGCAHLEAEGEPRVPRAPAQPVLALRVEEGAVREGPARAPRGRAGEQRPQQE